MPSKRAPSRTSGPKRETVRDLLLEIGTEEIPSNVMAVTLHQLARLAEQCFEEAGIPSGRPQTYGTPRRLILYVPNLSPRQNAKSERIIGPPKKIAFDPHGKPTPAACGFAKSQGVDVARLSVITTEKGEYLAFEKKEAGRQTGLLLKEVLPDMIARLSFPRAMRWTNQSCAFVRPIRWMVALYADKVVPFTYAGVKTGATSYGHRLMAPAPFTVLNFTSYQEEMRRRFVLIDPDERFNLIQEEIRRQAKRCGGIVEEDDRLIWEAVHTVEYPVAICGAYQLSGIPKEVIIAPMKEHQGYFPVIAPSGALLPYFIAITNHQTKAVKTIIRGNERVLGARLSDARFYFEQDRKKRLADLTGALKGVTFQEKLGSLSEKGDRLVRLVAFLARSSDCERLIPDLERAARLCKCDLLTGVVREFPSLQGTIGEIYARLDGESTVVSDAIKEHYAPRTSGDMPPKTLAGQILSVADKCDTIVGCFGVGLTPSGSEDPYALRRQGLGLIQMMAADGPLAKVSLADLIANAIDAYTAQGKFPRETIHSHVMEFLRQRAISFLQAQEIRYDVIDAVLSSELTYPKNRIDCARALSQFSKMPLFEPMMTAFRRAMRILPKDFQGSIDFTLLTGASETRLHEAIKASREKIGQAGLDFQQGFSLLATLYEPLNQFFNEVMVMDPNPKLRENRLALMKQVCELFNSYGDFSKISGG